SDADVILHALINALLGAMGKGDIGSHFPDSDPKYKDVSSEIFLKKILRMMAQGGYQLINGDLTVIAQRPRMAPFYGKIRGNLARLLKVPRTRMNVKAATTEQLGWIGQGGGIAAIAVVLLEKSRDK
ncbi:MAG: 2-C-methyl-D-erythritol 2,4-cyclodiphosphate synthase, partial [Candidatus Binatia bacterium]|nr:2-C-methyl-D-erythritol 2,4-cyclodiphosphate synthase [Candidatus Binatia bacterium]